jgi:hypothetical protein
MLKVKKKPLPPEKLPDDQTYFLGTGKTSSLNTVPVPSNVRDLTGTVRGNVKITGYLGGGKWKARCICGKTVIRDGKRWKKGLGKSSPDRGCNACNRKPYVENDASF